MTYVPKIENGGVVICESPSGRRVRKITGWPDAEKLTNVNVSGDDLVVQFNTGRTRVYDIKSGSLISSHY